MASDWESISKIIGTLLGIYNLIHARQKEKREEQAREREKEEGEADWRLLVAMIEASRQGDELHPDNGSELHRQLERMVQKGTVERLHGGYIPKDNPPPKNLTVA